MPREGKSGFHNCVQSGQSTYRGGLAVPKPHCLAAQSWAWGGVILLCLNHDTYLVASWPRRAGHIGQRTSLTLLYQENKSKEEMAQ